MTHKNRWQSRAIDRTGRRLGEVGTETPKRRRAVARMLTLRAEVEAENIEVREKVGLKVR